MRGLYLFSALFVCSLYAADINDPFEDINRSIFNFNESIDKNFLKPVAKVYSKTPEPIKKGVTNFFNNLEEVETSINQVFQGKPKRAINDISRFIINSSLGIGGFIDVASKLGMPSHDEDFAQTLALWGTPSGPYIMLPALGPSSLRDTLSKPFSSFLSVTFHMTEDDVNLS